MGQYVEQLEHHCLQVLHDPLALESQTTPLSAINLVLWIVVNGHAH